MPAEPVVSVVVATRNRADRLRALLESLAAQTLPSDDFEVIVVDDSSTDATPSVLAGERPAQVRTIRREFSQGPAAARNDGWQAARGPARGLHRRRLRGRARVAG